MCGIELAVKATLHLLVRAGTLEGVTAGERLAPGDLHAAHRGVDAGGQQEDQQRGEESSAHRRASCASEAQSPFSSSSAGAGSGPFSTTAIARSRCSKVE